MDNIVFNGEDLKFNYKHGIQLADKYCTDKCQGYHKQWFERRKNEGGYSSPAVTTPFLVSSLITASIILKDRALPTISVLIAGSADTKILSLVNAVFEEVGIYCNSTVNIKVIDSCRTPLALCEIYGGEKKFDLTTLHGEMPNILSDLHADLIVMSGVLQFMTPDAQISTMLTLSENLTRDSMIVFSHSYARSYAPRENARFGFESSNDIREIFQLSKLYIFTEIDGKILLPFGEKGRRDRYRYSAILKKAIN